MTIKNPKVDALLAKAKRWPQEMKKLREIFHCFEFTEEMKWHQPCYTYQKRIVALIGPFKEYVAIAFFKGALLKDTKKILIKPGENTQGVRHIRLTSVQQIDKMEPIIKAYIKEAIAIEKAGMKLPPRAEVKIPAELHSKFKKMPDLKTSFNKLTPGRKRAYILYFSAPKQSITRQARIEKFIPQILKGKGMSD